MLARDFCYWLQGYFEINGSENHGFTSKQANQIRKHLALVFQHDIDPSMGDEKHQVVLNHIHNASETLVRC